MSTEHSKAPSVNKASNSQNGANKMPVRQKDTEDMCAAVCRFDDVNRHTATYRNELKRTATQYNTLHHTPTYCNTLQHTAAHSNTLQRTATHWSTLQRTARRCRILQTLQYTATHLDIGQKSQIIVSIKKAAMLKRVRIYLHILE